MPDFARFPIPSDPAPEGSVCYAVPVPDDPEHRRVFFQVLEMLAIWVNWERDNEHNAKIVADRWEQALNEVTECMSAVTDVRQNPTTPCILEKSIDGGAWVQFADLKKCPPQIRNNGGKLQYSTDGGATWQDINTQPPDGGTFSPKDTGTIKPPRTGSNIACLAARNAEECIHQLHTYMVNWYNTYGTVLTIAQFLTGIIAVFIPMEWPIALAIVSYEALGSSMLALADALNTGTYDTSVTETLTCLFYCYADSNGQWSAEHFAALMTELAGHTEHIYQLVHLWLDQVIGIVGLNNAGTTNSVGTYDCSGCECAWCYQFDFVAGDGGWIVHDGNAALYGGQGWGVARTTPPFVDYITRSIQIARYFDSTYINTVEVEFSPVDEGSNGGEGWYKNDGGALLDYSQHGSSPVTFTVNDTIGAIRILLDKGFSEDSIYGDYLHTFVRTITIRGRGVCPFGTPNC